MRRTLVFGPAYLDRVIRVDRPLLDEGVLDGSFDGRMQPDPRGLRLIDPAGGEIIVHGLGSGGSDPLGRIELSARLSDRPFPWSRTVRAVSESFDLGGMGAGYAAAFGGTLVSALGPFDQPILDPVGSRVAALLTENGIPHRPIRVPDRGSDWSLIVSSGAHGDKLAVGFRGCHSSVRDLDRSLLAEPCDLLVVAALPNHLLDQALRTPAAIRFVAPAMRNMRDDAPPLRALAGRFDLLSCNQREWESLADREVILRRTPIVAVTDGPDGCTLYFRDPDSAASSIHLPVFPRDAPPRDTNRAGESFAAALVSTLLDSGWTPGPTDPSLIRHAGLRASAAAALVLDREDFGFPEREEIDRALRAGRVIDEKGGRIG